MNRLLVLLLLLPGFLSLLSPPATAFARELPPRHFNSPTKRASSERYVFCHIVQGNFQSYTAEEWDADIVLAKAAGIDAL